MPTRSSPFRAAVCTTPRGDISRSAHGERHVCTCRSALIFLNTADTSLIQPADELKSRKLADQDRDALLLGLGDRVLLRLASLDEDDTCEVLVGGHRHDILMNMECD